MRRQTLVAALLPLIASCAGQPTRPYTRADGRVDSVSAARAFAWSTAAPR